LDPHPDSGRFSLSHPMGYVFTVEPAHASRTGFSVQSRRLNALVDLMLKD